MEYQKLFQHHKESSKKLNIPNEILEEIEVTYLVDDEWEEADLTAVGSTSIEELTPFYDQYLDYTYFTKIKYGFALADIKAKKNFMDTLM